MSALSLLIAFGAKAQGPILFKTLIKEDVVVKDKYGYKDAKGNIIIKPIYDCANDFSGNRAVVNIGSIATAYGMVGGRWGFINQKGVVVIDLKFSEVRSFTENIAAVKTFKKSGETAKWGFIDTSGNWITHPVYKEVRNFEGGIAIVRMDEKWGAVNREGQVILPIEYDKIKDFANGYAIISKKDKYGLIDKNGKVAIQPVFDDMGDVSEGVIAAKKKDKWGYVNPEGKVIVKFSYHRAGNFKEGMGVVGRYNGPILSTPITYGFVNEKGKQVVPCIYEYAFDFKNGEAELMKNGKFHVIDRSGKVLRIED